jgi:hypothetical protein
VTLSVLLRSSVMLVALQNRKAGLLVQTYWSLGLLVIAFYCCGSMLGFSLSWNNIVNFSSSYLF